MRDRVVSVFAAAPAPEGLVEAILPGQLPTARVRWDNGQIGRHTITTIRRC